MTDPLTDAREQIEGDRLLRRAEYELLSLDPDEELRINLLGALWRFRDHMRDALVVAQHARGDDATEQREQFGIADRDFRQALADFYPDDKQEQQ